jgi:hypothetical protein
VEMVVGTVDCPAVASEGGERLAVANVVVHRAHDDDDLAIGWRRKVPGKPPSIISEGSCICCVLLDVSRDGTWANSGENTMMGVSGSLAARAATRQSSVWASFEAFAAMTKVVVDDIFSESVC